MCWGYLGKKVLCSSEKRCLLSLLDVVEEACDCERCWELFAALYEADHTEKDEKKQNEPRALTIILYL